MTPLGHLAVSYSAGKPLSRPLRVSLPHLVLGGVAPDIDFLLLPFSSFNTLHRSLTHNLFFVVATALLFALWRSASASVFFSALLGGCGHLLIDSLFDSNPSNGVGVALLWPLSQGFFSPFNLTPGVCPSWSELLAAARCNASLIFWEVPFYLSALLLRFASRSS
ncbi:MAG: hypothetical protein AVDCRST_MAG86-996 [uncultured Truepera sp.]|uniref:Membrane-bound metal-dependent hydrolase YdjM, induced during SOS response n=1 Tax=uncultured Truepera sp. TaxID=543023 RepID=A0A6J4UZN2_9DEIN|nr:MAG: hypothetical protein AVDCRST_MAG86-996 [uncultured Truepera sp.]